MINIRIALIALLVLVTNFNSISFASNMTVRNAHNFTFNSIDGDKINLANFKGKVILVVNTASKCGFTPQYQALQQLYDKYKDRGLVIIGVPSGDFAKQEFSELADVKKFTTNEFKVTFPLTTINSVTGANAHNFYLWANKEAGFIGSPKWNFHKYLLDKDGNLAAWFSSPTDPQSSKIINKIEELL